MSKRVKRVLGGIGGILLAIALLIGIGGYSAFGGRLPIVDGAHVGATIEIVQDGFVSAAIVDLGNDHVALIDCGNDPDAHTILAALERRHLGVADVSDVFLTHGHRDHVAGCPVFTHATIHALEADVALAEGREGMHSPMGRFVSPRPTGVTVTHVLHDRDVVTIGNAEVRVYALAGHTAGSAAYLVDGVLFVGDSASVSSDHHLLPAVWLFSNDTTQNHASLRALGAQLEHETVTAIVPAHSGVLDEGDLAAALRAM
jgi:glyoxylase-like metal-dependent hydrolase (beta-lactamase superfamily II)